MNAAELVPFVFGARVFSLAVYNCVLFSLFEANLRYLFLCSIRL